MHGLAILASSVHWGGFKWTGSYTTIDLIAASTNALNGALLARRPDHYRNFTVVGILLMALLGGLGGGITRDVLVGEIPVGADEPRLHHAGTRLRRDRLPPRIHGRAAVPRGAVPVHDLVLAALVRDRRRAERRHRRPARSSRCVLLAVVGPTAGRYYIDITSGVPPKQFIRGEWFVAIAALTGLIWILLTWAGVGPWWATGISFVVGFTVRVIALYRAWEEPLAKEPAGVYKHSDGRPMLGRKLAGKSQRELQDLGLTVETGSEAAPGQTDAS